MDDNNKNMHSEEPDDLQGQILRPEAPISGHAGNSDVFDCSDNADGFEDTGSSDNSDIYDITNGPDNTEGSVYMGGSGTAFTDAPETAASDAIHEDSEISEDLSDGGHRFARELYEWAQALVYSVVFVVVLFTFFVRVIGVDGTSMEPTLYNNDKIVVTNIMYTPKQGDIVVLRKKSFIERPIVKRVIATEGQTVDIDFISHMVWVDGELLEEPYIKAPTAREGDMEFPLTVPEGCIFVLGDNRNNSADSRMSRLGVVDDRYVLGHVIFRVYPIGGIGKVE